MIELLTRMYVLTFPAGARIVTLVTLYTMTKQKDVNKFCFTNVTVEKIWDFEIFEIDNHVNTSSVLSEE
jgi:hypothetical protein